ncbi:unnamed protein product [Arabidopsis halleri]
MDRALSIQRCQKKKKKNYYHMCLVLRYGHNINVSMYL